MSRGRAKAGSQHDSKSHSLLEALTTSADITTNNVIETVIKTLSSRNDINPSLAAGELSKEGMLLKLRDAWHRELSGIIFDSNATPQSQRPLFPLHSRLTEAVRNIGRVQGCLGIPQAIMLTSGAKHKFRSARLGAVPSPTVIKRPIIRRRSSSKRQVDDEATSSQISACAVRRYHSSGAASGGLPFSPIIGMRIQVEICGAVRVWAQQESLRHAAFKSSTGSDDTCRTMSSSSGSGGVPSHGPDNTDHHVEDLAAAKWISGRIISTTRRKVSAEHVEQMQQEVHPRFSTAIPVSSSASRNTFTTFVGVRFHNGAEIELPSNSPFLRPPEITPLTESAILESSTGSSVHLDHILPIATNPDHELDDIEEEEEGEEDLLGLPPLPPSFLADHSLDTLISQLTSSDLPHSQTEERHSHEPNMGADINIRSDSSGKCNRGSAGSTLGDIGDILRELDMLSSSVAQVSLPNRTTQQQRPAGVERSCLNTPSTGRRGKSTCQQDMVETQSDIAHASPALPVLISAPPTSGLSDGSWTASNGTSTVMQVLATGERVPKALLDEIVQHFSRIRHSTAGGASACAPGATDAVQVRKRPRCVLNPTQAPTRDVLRLLHLGTGRTEAPVARGGYGYASWLAGRHRTRPPPGPGAATAPSNSTQVPTDPALLDWEDPSVPTPTPDAIILGRLRKVRN